MRKNSGKLQTERMSYLDKQLCMECKKEYNRNELYWIKDNYGIPFKKVCEECYDDVEEYIRGNNYGDELTYYELYGEDD